MEKEYVKGKGRHRGGEGIVRAGEGYNMDF